MKDLLNEIFEICRLVNGGVLNENWIQVKKFFPNVKQPLFHKTRGISVIDILKKGFDAKVRGNLGGVGISFSRSLSWAVSPHIEGYFIFVLDKADFNKKDFIPVSHPDVSDEFEERFIGKHISPNKIKGLLVLRKLYSYEKHLENLSFPVLYMTKDRWKHVTF